MNFESIPKLRGGNTLSERSWLYLLRAPVARRVEIHQQYDYYYNIKYKFSLNIPYYMPKKI